MRYIFGILMILFLHSCKNGDQKKNIIEIDQSSVATLKLSKDVLLSTDTILTNYYLLKNTFIEADSTNIDKSATIFSQSLKNYSTLISNENLLANPVGNEISSLVKNADSISLKNDLISKKRVFSSISDTLYSLLQNLQYGGHMVYRQMCPMAFNDNEKARWLSQYSEIENPYMGKKHPKYGAGMLHCGEVLDSLNYSR